MDHYYLNHVLTTHQLAADLLLNALAAAVYNYRRATGVDLYYTNIAMKIF